MRILHTEASTGWGGQEIRILTESQIFIKHDHDMMLAADVDSQIAKKANEYGIKVFPINLKKKRWADFKALRKLIQQEKPDIISCHSSTDHWLSALSRLTIRHKPAIVRTRHISTPVTRNLPTKWLYNKGTDAIMTTGETIRNQLLSDDFVASDVTFSIPTGIDTDRFIPDNVNTVREQLNLPANHFIFGIVATLRSWKGHSDLIKAFDHLNNPNTTLIIIGDGPQMDNCKKLASNTQYPTNILFFGNQNNVLPYFQAMDCFVLPSYANEGVPQALLQAMAVGVPVISCPIGGIPESVKNYSQSHLVPPQNVDALFKAMQLEMTNANNNVTIRTRHTPFTLYGMYKSALEVYILSTKKRKAKPMLTN